MGVVATAPTVKILVARRKKKIMKNKFSVSGMTCSNCSLAVEKAIKKLNGVKSVTVSLIEKLAIVEYDENVVSIPDIISAVKQKGYGCNLSEKTEKNTCNPFFRVLKSEPRNAEKETLVRKNDRKEMPPTESIRAGTDKGNTPEQIIRTSMIRYRARVIRDTR